MGVFDKKDDKPEPRPDFSNVRSGGSSTAPAASQPTGAIGSEDESTQTIAPAGDARTEFHISKPDGWPTGKYTLEVFLNGSSAATKDLEVDR